MKKFLLLSSIILTITIVLALLIEEEIFHEETEISFSQGENKLIGYFIRSINTSGLLPVIVFVHGDGAMPYDAFGFYRPIWNYLAENGIASLSWHKPGVESSTGNWLFQRMQDRADEVIAGIEVLKSQHSIPVSQIGLIGFSQAG